MKFRALLTAALITLPAAASAQEPAAKGPIDLVHEGILAAEAASEAAAEATPADEPIDEPADEPIDEPIDEPADEPEQAQTADERREAEMFGSDEDSAREAEMFGSPDDGIDETGETGEATTRDDRVLSGGLLSEATIEDRLESGEDPLAIGGLLFMRMAYDIREEGKPEEFALSAPNLLDVYLDARPNDRVRGFVRGRLTYDYTIDPEAVNPLTGETAEKSTVALDQLWLKFDIARKVFVTAGKQRIKWGSGRFWNPTDFLNNERLDPLSITTFDERLGVTLLKAHIPIESLGWNFYVIGTFDDATKPEDVGGALRGEFLVELTELALSAAARRNNPYRLGADVTTGLGPFDLRAEVAALYDDERPYYRGELEIPTTFPETYLRDDEWILQASAGAEVGIRYSDEDTLYVGGEYFFNDAGYDGPDLYPWLIAQGRFTPFYLGRHYAAIYGLLPGPGQWDDTSFALAGFGNASDESFLVRLDYNVTILTYLAFNAYGSVAFGENGEFNFGLELPEFGTFQGVDLAQPLFDLGIGLRLAI